MNTRKLLLLVMAATLLPAAAGAQDYEIAFSAGATHSDNVRRRPPGEEVDDTMLEAGISADVEKSGRLSLALEADARFLSYTDDSFGDELVGGFDGSLAYEFVPDRFSWTVQDNFGQLLIDPQDIDTATNRQDFNYLTTGPDFTLPLGSRTQLQLSGRWSDVTYGETDIDNEKLRGSLALVRTLGAASSLSFNGATQRVEFDSGAQTTGYDLHSAFMSYQSQGARTTLLLQAGYMEHHDEGVTSDGPLFNLSLTREMSERTTLSIDVGTEFGDAADAFRRDRGVSDITLGTEDTITSADVFQQEYATLSWAFAGARTEAAVSASWRDESHEIETALDRERTGASLSFTRRLSPRLSAVLSGWYEHERFATGDIRFEEWNLALGLDWRLGARYLASLGVERFDGDGDTSSGAGQRDYDEMRYSLRFSYQLGR